MSIVNVVITERPSYTEAFVEVGGDTFFVRYMGDRGDRCSLDVWIEASNGRLDPVHAKSLPWADAFAQI